MKKAPAVGAEAFEEVVAGACFALFRQSPPERASDDVGAGRFRLRRRVGTSALRRTIIRGHPVEYSEVLRDESPRWTIAREYCDCRMEGRRVVQRAGVDSERVALANHAAEYQAAACGAEIAYRVPAPCRFRYELPGWTTEAHGAACKTHERNESRTGRLLAIGAVAVTLGLRLAVGFITQRATKAAAGVTHRLVTHRHILSVVNIRPCNVLRQIGRSIDAANGVKSFGPAAVMYQQSSIRMPNSPGI